MGIVGGMIELIVIWFFLFIGYFLIKNIWSKIKDLLCNKMIVKVNILFIWELVVIILYII